LLLPNRTQDRSADNDTVWRIDHLILQTNYDRATN